MEVVPHAPVSWVGLVACLKSAKLHRMADDIESAYCMEEKAESHTNESSTDEEWTQESLLLILGKALQTRIRYLIYTFIAAGIIVQIFLVRFWLRTHSQLQAEEDQKNSERGKTLLAIILLLVCKCVTTHKNEA